MLAEHVIGDHIHWWCSVVVPNVCILNTQVQNVDSFRYDLVSTYVRAKLLQYERKHTCLEHNERN